MSVGDVLEQLHRLRLLHGRHDISPDARQSAENASSPVSGDVAGVLRDTPPASPVSPAHAVRGRPKP